jgi:voltage-gated potassium channel
MDGSSVTLHVHHRRAFTVIAVAAVLDAGLGLAFAAADHVSPGDGLYWAVTTATTVGYGDVVPRGGTAHLIAIGVMLTVIPLFGAAFSLFTSGLASQDIHSRLAAAEQRIKDHTEARLRHHLKGGTP